jgi:virulence-associated protein VapD
MRYKARPNLRVIREPAQAERGTRRSEPHLSNSPHWGQRVYAIAFDLDTELLNAHYPGASPNNGYEDIRRVLEAHGFARQQGSVYFGQRPDISSVNCVLAVQDLAKRHPWFRLAVRDIRMLRIEETNDLMPAVGDYGELPFENADAAE